MIILVFPNSSKTKISFLQVTGDVEMKLDIDKEIKKQEDIELEASEDS